ncbi:MAG TPA: hypothetical protein VGE22_12120 [Solimonas sp.]
MDVKGSTGWIVGVLACVLLSACGEYGGRSDAASDGSGGATARSMEEHFSGKVQPQLDFCRTCHVPGKPGDVENGKDFMLSENRSEDLQNLRASWERLGKNNLTSRILLMSSGQETPHSGGAPWAVGSAPYRNMEILLKCFESPAGCAALLAGGVDPGTLLPLLAEGHRGSHTWTRYCEGKDDSAELPTDARKLVQPGVSDGKAVHFNLFWEECRSKADPTYEEPKTCGEYRGWLAQGETLIKGNGAIGAGVVVGGSSTDTIATVSANSYNSLWRLWGMPGRPVDYDQLVAERWGMALPDEPNPYPVGDEDPNASGGGSGKLPMGLTQLRNEDGSWTGKMGITCHGCHSARIGSKADGDDLGSVYGTAGQGDLGAFIADFGNGIGKLLPITVNKVRGTGDVTNYQLLVMLWLIGDAPARPGIDLDSFIFAPATATEDSPIWWNVGHRPAKFYSGAMPTDATRILLQAYMPLLRSSDVYNWQEIQRWTDAHDRQAEAWVASLKAPRWPAGTLGEIDTAKAEQGAVLFHSKDLWGAGLDNPVPRPEAGNGSCASCHGAYSPRYVNDPAYLATPELEGQAAFRVPKEIIGTDTAYTLAQNQGVTDYFKYSWLFYPAAPGEVGACYGSDDYRDYQGYTAPPLYGVWASAPYFHNGSVPSVEEVLDPTQRKPIWRRVSAPNSNGSSRVVMGFDSDLKRAYDAEALGWKYEEVSCGLGGALPIVECNLLDPSRPTLLSQIQAILNRAIGLTWNLDIPLLTQQQLENRKVYNTTMYSQGNQGHEFTSVLTEQERRAIIEYLKTL